MNRIIATDRYGGNWPDPETVCKGDCEGMGTYPEEVDGKHVFVKCERCNGTGKEPSPELGEKKGQPCRPVEGR